MAKSRAWLVALIREITARGSPPHGSPFADVAAYEAWLARALHDRGFATGIPVDVLRGLELGRAVGYDEYPLLNATAHELSCALALLRWQGLAADGLRDGLVLFAVTAHAVERVDLARRIYDLLDREGLDQDELLRAVNEVGVALADALEARAIGSDDPLRGHPFHQLLRYQEALRFGRVAWLVVAALGRPSGRPDPLALARIHGEAEHALYQAIHATVALAGADGVVDDHERRLVEALVAAGRCGAHEARAIRAELDDPPSVDEVADALTDPVQRDLVLRLLLVTAHVNDRYEDAESAFLEALARRFGMPAGALDRFEAEALVEYERQGDLVDALSLGGVVRRMRRHLVARVERAVRKNARRLADEVRETSELFELLAKASTSELSPEEKEAVRAQLTDICKTIPALAIFVIPGGSILLPIAIKHLPFDLLPSNFVDRETL